MINVLCYCLCFRFRRIGCRDLVFESTGERGDNACSGVHCRSIIYKTNIQIHHTRGEEGRADFPSVAFYVPTEPRLDRAVRATPVNVFAIIATAENACTQRAQMGRAPPFKGGFLVGIVWGKTQLITLKYYIRVMYYALCTASVIGGSRAATVDAVTKPRKANSTNSTYYFIGVILYTVRDLLSRFTP